LYAAPFNLVQGNSVFAKVIATNIFGDSLESEPGAGALIQIVPSAPTSVSNVAAVTNNQVIGLAW
jgi:hypothetical protein